MMNKIAITCFALLFRLGLQAQNGGEELLRSTIDSSFEAFHKQDSIAIKETVSKDIVMQTIGRNGNGLEEVRVENFSQFLKSIMSIPAITKFEERIKS